MYRHYLTTPGDHRTCGKGGDETETNTHHTARQPASHERKANEQEQPRTPHRACISKVLVSLHAVLVDEVDDEHAEQGADARKPVEEGDVHRGRQLRLVVRRMGVRGEDGGVEECPICESKLMQRSYSVYCQQ